jgi:hypothetical protein
MNQNLATQPALLAAKHWQEYVAWKLRPAARRSGFGAPPLYKQKTIALLAQRHQLRILVETGTYRGNMVYAMRNVFEHIYSIELSPELSSKAQERFRNYRHIAILHGDSAAVLPRLISSLSTPALFWLDGHYSGGITARGEEDSPITVEISSILEQMKMRFAVVADDARFFNGSNGYPTIEQLRNLVAAKGRRMKLAVDNDLIRIIPE